jgi:hypothetical protein
LDIVWIWFESALDLVLFLFATSICQFRLLLYFRAERIRPVHRNFSIPAFSIPNIIICTAILVVIAKVYPVFLNPDDTTGRAKEIEDLNTGYADKEGIE